MDVKLALCQMIGQSTGMGNDLHELNEKDIVHKQKLCMEILNVANVISPGKKAFIKEGGFETWSIMCNTFKAFNLTYLQVLHSYR